MAPEHVAALERVQAPAERQQEALVPDGATPEEARVLMLQRQAGNRAVTSLLQGSVKRPIQREISFKPNDLEATLSFKDRVRTTFATDTYSKIIEALRAFHRTRDPDEKLRLAHLVALRTDTWLNRHTRNLSRKETAQRSKLIDLKAEAMREVGKLRAAEIYLRDAGTQGGFKGINPMHQVGYAEIGEDLHAGNAPGGPGADQKAVAFVAQYKLSAAEATAIRTFTAQDYAYINPATANDNAWMTASLVGAQDPHLKQYLPRPMEDSMGAEFSALKAEGSLHAGMLMQAVSKLEPYRDITYRGLRETAAGFKAKYKEGALLPVSTAFSSSSKLRAAAERFARGEGGNTVPPADRTVHVLLVMVMTNGRDITKLSAAGKTEEEVLILPGAQFTVERVVQLPTGPLTPAGKPPATDWYTVFVKQTK